MKNNVHELRPKYPEKGREIEVLFDGKIWKGKANGHVNADGKPYASLYVEGCSSPAMGFHVPYWRYPGEKGWR